MSAKKNFAINPKSVKIAKLPKSVNVPAEFIFSQKRKGKVTTFIFSCLTH